MCEDMPGNTSDKRQRHFTVAGPKLFQIIVLVTCFGLLTGLPFAEEPGYTISFQFENDFFGGGTDRHFTHGTRLECMTKPVEWITKAAHTIPWFRSGEGRDEKEKTLQARASFSLGQNIYTPENTATTALVQEDRPYAGWLYMGFGVVADQGHKRYDKLELEVGVVGPSAFAKEVQTYWHSLFGLRVPQGWDNQLKDEPGVVLYYEQARRFKKAGVIPGAEFDVIPYFGGSLGNVLTHVAAGFTVRVGSRLDDDFGPPRIRPSLPGGAYFQPGKGFRWYFFAGLDGRWVLYNIFLDGNTFTDSHEVDKRPLVGDLQAGLVFQWSRVRLSYTQIFRTKEFYGQDRPDIFGSLSVSYHF